MVHLDHVHAGSAYAAVVDEGTVFETYGLLVEDGMAVDVGEAPEGEHAMAEEGTWFDVRKRGSQTT